MQPKQPKAEREKQEMSENQFGEPWKFRDDITHDPSGEPISEWDRSRDQRIVACVNALAGIPNPEAVRELIEACQSAADNGAMCEWVRPFVAALGDVPSARNNAIRELIEAATGLREKFNHVNLTRLYAAVESLSAPSPGAQQK